MEYRYQQENLDEVLRFYVSKFRPKNGEKIRHSEAFLDTNKGKVVFKLLLETPPHNKPGSL